MVWAAVLIPGLLIIILFVLPLLLGAPFKFLHRQKASEVLDLLDLKSNQTLLVVGSGAGKSLKLAAQRGIKVTGYEINPILIILSMFRCVSVRQLVAVKWVNWWKADLDVADGMCVFLLPAYMVRLNAKLTIVRRPVKVVTYKDALHGDKPVKTSGNLALYEFKPPK